MSAVTDSLLRPNGSLLCVACLERAAQKTKIRPGVVVPAGAVVSPADVVGVDVSDSALLELAASLTDFFHSCIMCKTLIRDKFYEEFDGGLFLLLLLFSLRLRAVSWGLIFAVSACALQWHFTRVVSRAFIARSCSLALSRRRYACGSTVAGCAARGARCRRRPRRSASC